MPVPVTDGRDPLEVTVTLADSEHRHLTECATRMIRRLREFRDLLAPRRVSHQQHYEFADRAHSLSLYLEAALTLSRAELYPASFSTLRVCLEHQVFDQLVFLGRRFVQTTRDAV